MTRECVISPLKSAFARDTNPGLKSVAEVVVRRHNPTSVNLDDVQCRELVDTDRAPHTPTQPETRLPAHPGADLCWIRTFTSSGWLACSRANLNLKRTILNAVDYESCLMALNRPHLNHKPRRYTADFC